MEPALMFLRSGWIYGQLFHNPIMEGVADDSFKMQNGTLTCRFKTLLSIGSMNQDFQSRAQFAAMDVRGYGSRMKNNGEL
jgi:hypothetical protein